MSGVPVTEKGALYPDANQYPVVVLSQPEAISFPTKGGSVTVRNMVKDDCEFAGSMTVDAFESKYEKAVGKNNIDKMKRAEAKVHADLEDCYHRIFIASLNQEKAGLLALMFHGDKQFCSGTNHYSELGCYALCRLICLGYILEESSVPSGVCYLDHICVDSAFRGKGIGKVLLDKAEEEARKKNCHSIYLWVADENRAKNLYLRQGYQIVKRKGGMCSSSITGYRVFLKMQKSLYQ